MYLPMTTPMTMVMTMTAANANASRNTDDNIDTIPLLHLMMNDDSVDDDFFWIGWLLYVLATC